MTTPMNLSAEPSAPGAETHLKAADLRKSATRRTAQTQSATLPKPKIEKPTKFKKMKLVRDRFTIPKTEYAVVDELKERANKLAHKAKKSELLRAGVKALAAMPDAAFLGALNAVPTIKTRNTKN